MPIRPSWFIVLCKYSIFLIFFLLVLFIVESKIFTLTIIVNFFFDSVSFSLMYLGALLIGVCMFIIVVCYWSIIVIYIFLCLFVCLFFAIFRATLAAHGASQARSWIGAIAAGLHHSHSNAGSKTCLWPTPQLMAMPDP